MKAPLSSLLAQDSVPAVTALVIAWQGSTRHSGLANRKQKLASLMQRIQKLEIGCFKNKHLGKACRQTAQAGRRQQSVAASGSQQQYIHSEAIREGWEKPTGKAEWLPTQQVQPHAGYTAKILSPNRQINTKDKSEWFRWWVGCEYSWGTFH